MALQKLILTIGAWSFFCLSLHAFPRPSPKKQDVFGELERQLLQMEHRQPNREPANTQCRCQSYPISYNLTIDGCTPVSVLNRACQGSCPSQYTPELVKPGSAALQTCYQCAPSETHPLKVTLECGDNIKTFDIEIVDECSCVKCS